VSNQVSHPYKTTGKITVLTTVMKFLIPQNRRISGPAELRIFFPQN
jgi:hypothetical protein